MCVLSFCGLLVLFCFVFIFFFLLYFVFFVVFFFFFSSRRRHTRSYGDWSSDVCSSDLVIRNETNAATAKACSTSDTPYPLRACPFFDSTKTRSPNHSRGPAHGVAAAPSGCGCHGVRVLTRGGDRRGTATMPGGTRIVRKPHKSGCASIDGSDPFTRRPLSARSPGTFS